MSKPPKKKLTDAERIEKFQKLQLKYNPIMHARNAIRREFSRSPTVILMMIENSRTTPLYKKDGSRAKNDAREHLCDQCGQWVRSTKDNKVSIDHIDPVVCPKVGFIDMNTYFSRMFVARKFLQKLCGPCHQTKTNAEWFERRFKEELSLLRALEMTSDATVVKKALQKYTPKRLAQFPYPQDFKDGIILLKNKYKK